MGKRWLLLLLLSGLSGVTRLAAAQNDPYDRAVKRAVALLPRRPPTIVVIDANDAKPEVRRTLLRLDSFILRGRSEIYLTQHSEVLKRALNGSQLYEHMLATIIWHEMAHLSGGDERAARKAEQDLWTRFVRDGVCDELTGLRYLRALADRPDDRVLASLDADQILSRR